MTTVDRRIRAGLVCWALSLLIAAAAATMLIFNTPAWRAAGWNVLLLNGLAPLGAALAYGGFGALLVTRQPRNRVGWLLLWIGVLFGLTLLGSGVGYYSFARGGHSSSPLPGALWAAWMQNWTFVLVFPVGFGLLLLLFPDGRPPTLRWRPVLWAGLATMTAFAIGTMVTSGRLAIAFAPGSHHSVTTLPVDNPTGLIPRRFVPLDPLFIGGFVFVLASAASLFVRHRRAAAVERQQLRWLAYVGGIFALGISGNVFASLPAANQFLSAVSTVAFDLMVAMAVIGFPLAVAIAVLRYRLYDIDVVINKTLVYATLTAFIGSVYILIVVGLGHLIGGSGRPSLALSIAATAVVAIAFEPVRERVQRFMNRLVYGRRATPYEVLAGFSHRMAATLSVEEVLPRMAEAAARGVGGSHAEVTLALSAGERVASWPPGSTLNGSGHRAAVGDRGEQLGEVRVVKSTGEPLTGAESGLIDMLAAQAGPVFRNVRLTLELQARLEAISAQAGELRASRQRIVAAADSQRRRVEREIHDNTEPQLLAIAAELERSERLLAADPATAVPLLDALNAQANRALNQLREMARGIFPPLLADRGPVVALEAHARKLQVPVRIEATDAVRATRFAPEVEATIYFCCVEALRGVTTELGLSLDSVDGRVTFRVTGYGGDAGLREMTDRVAAVGGTLVADARTVRATIPARALEPAA
ncbi:MAG: sensor histidine kinase [Candidatus Dormibacteria bacterium]